MRGVELTTGSLVGDLRTSKTPLAFCIEWNAENQLVRVTKNSVEVARYGYDPFGRRVEKVTSGVTTSWAYDNEDILREVVGSDTRKYVHGPDIDEPLARLDQAGGMAHLHTDGLGSVARTTNASGAVAVDVRYDAWGVIEAGGVGTYGFTGREPESETGLMYYRARYYDPRAGRFVSEDPIGIEGGILLFGYANNDPVSARDPLGLKTECYIRRILVTAYCDKGPGSDWPYYKPQTKGGAAGSVGPGTCAAANSSPSPWPMGAQVTVLSASGSGYDYTGTIHDTGAGWDCKHHCVKPSDWMDIWLPCSDARQWGKQWRTVRVCYDTDDNKCSKCPK